MIELLTKCTRLCLIEPPSDWSKVALLSEAQRLLEMSEVEVCQNVEE